MLPPCWRVLAPCTDVDYELECPTLEQVKERYRVCNNLRYSAATSALGQTTIPAGSEPALLKDIEGRVKLGITSASKSFWINVYENVRLHA